MSDLSFSSAQWIELDGAAPVHNLDFSLPIHLKINTGAKRQGVQVGKIDEPISSATKHGLDVVGLATHFANIEDTLEHEFARAQLDRFHDAVERTTRLVGRFPRSFLPRARPRHCCFERLIFPWQGWAFHFMGTGRLVKPSCLGFSNTVVIA